MAYDESSFYGDMIVDEYDEQNNLMNPESPTGFLFYKIIGDAFDLMSEMVSQFMNDISILTANPKSLDKFWGVSYNMPRPKIHHNGVILFEDKAITDDHNENYSILSGNVIKTVTDAGTSLEGGGGYIDALKIDEIFSNDFQIDFFYAPENNPIFHTFVLINENNTRYEILCTNGNAAGSNSDLSLHVPIDNALAEEGIFEGGKVTIKKEGYALSAYFNNQLTGMIPCRGNNFIFAFELYSEGKLSFSDLIVQDISENSVQLLTDDEYKIYLYLRNCRLMTREDIEINMNKCFGIYSGESSYEIYFSEEASGLELVDHIHYISNDTVSSNLHMNNGDNGLDFVTGFDSDEETMRILSGLSTNVENTLIINVPYQGWDRGFLEFLEQYLSTKGKLKIREYSI